MKITKGFKKMIHCQFLLMLIVGCMMTQNVLSQDAGQIRVSGVVLDAKKEPLIGVSIVVEGTTIGTTTDVDGKFTLSCPKGAKLNVSYVGYKTQKLTAASSMNMVLEEDAISLADVEVVGVGYGTMRKSDLTGAIASVSPDGMKQGVVTSSEQLLQGKIAGLTVVQGSGDPTAGAVMRLRGGSSLSGSNAPLVVVDGIANVDMNTIQPSDIVSIDVLKDASASAIYGSRGANGVIIVTTKRKGSDDKIITSAEYAGYLGVAEASNKLNLLTAANWAEHSANDLEGNTDWQEEIRQIAISQSHAVTFASGSQKGGYKGNISYLNSQGVIKTSQLERYGASVSGFTKVFDDRLTLDAGLHTSRDNYTNIDYKKVFQSTYGINPTLPVTDGNGVYQQDELAGPLYANPIEYLNNRFNDRSRDRLLIYSKAELDIWNGLKGTVNISRNHQIENNRLYVNRNARELQASIYKLDNVGNGGRATRDFTDYSEMQFEGFLTYDKTIQQHHRLNLLGGYSYSESIGEGHGAGVYGFQTDAFLYNNLEAAVNQQYTYSYKNKTNLISFFGRANYSYMGKYMLTATLRRDGSSKFGENNKWGLFPSGSLAWRLTDEAFMQSMSNWLNNLKLRVGYGVTGNQGGIEPYMSIESYGTSKFTAGIYQTIDIVTDDDGNIIGEKVRIIPIRNPNPDLKWESTEQVNVGLDFQIFKNLSGTFEFYHKNTKDLLYYYYVGADGVSTYNYTLMNIGSMTNTGVEFSLNATIMKNKRKGYNWDVNLNLAHNNNQITKLTDDRFAGTRFDAGLLPDIQGLSGNSYTQEIKEGYSIGSFFGAKYVGKDGNGKLLYQKTVDGNVGTTSSATEADRVYLGCAMPKLTLGFGTTLSYKNFDLGLNFNGMFGQKVYNGTAMDLHNISEHSNSNVLATALTDAQTPGISDYWLEDASFLRLQNLILGYTFNLSKFKMNSLRIYAILENLFVVTNYSGVDPEVSIDMNVTQELDANKTFPGIDYYNNYPKPRTIMFGVNLKF